MQKPDFQKTIEVLSQESAREILRILGDETKTVREIFEVIKNTSSILKNRVSVFKSLEKMVDAGLVEKIRERKRVFYRSNFTEIKADMIRDELQATKNVKGGSK